MHGIVLTGIVTGIFLMSCSNSHRDLANGKNESLTDSLIQVKQIHDKVILICFGSDAIAAINTTNGIVVVDAGISETLTAKYRSRIENRFKQNVFLYLINTHGHYDHTGGNKVFSDAGIIGHQNCAKEMEKQWKNPKKTLDGLKKTVDEYTARLKAEPLHGMEWENLFAQKMRYQHAYIDATGSIPLTKPDIIVQTHREIPAGEFTLDIMYFGRAHSESDLLIFIPELKILFTGDLFGPYGKPFFEISGKENAGEWKDAIAWLKQKTEQTEIIAAGHGLVMKREDLRAFTDALEQNAK